MEKITRAELARRIVAAGERFIAESRECDDHRWGVIVVDDFDDTQFLSLCLWSGGSVYCAENGAVTVLEKIESLLREYQVDWYSFALAGVDGVRLRDHNRGAETIHPEVVE